MILVRFASKPHVYQAPESSYFIAAVNRNTPHSPPVCSMFNKIAQYLKFFMFFPGVTITTSVSKWWRHHENFARYFEGYDLNPGYAPETPKLYSNRTCLAVISLDSAPKKDKSYYLQVFSKECKYIEKKSSWAYSWWFEWFFFMLLKSLMKNRLKLLEGNFERV